MSETAVADTNPLNQAMAALRNAWAGLAIGTGAIAVLFQPEIASAVRTWIDSTAYNHCALVIPIALYLLWDRAPALRGLKAVPCATAAILAVPAAVAWLAAERLGIMEGRQLAVVTLFEVLCLTMLGPRLWRAVMGPLLYLYFLVPFGEFLTPKLQDITAWFISLGVGFLGFPAYIDGYIIEIPEGVFYVAEACAGLRFLIASIAFGALYAILMYRSPVRRTVFFAVSIVVPIIANGFRALGIVWLGHILGSAEAAAADHIVYGWIFFSFVILLLTVLGLPFREDTPPVAPDGPPMEHTPTAARLGLIGGIAAAAIAALGPLATMSLNRPATIPAAALRSIELSPACAAKGPAIPVADSPNPGMSQHVVCTGLPILVRVDVFSRNVTAGPINAQRRRLTRPPEADDIAESPLTDAAGTAGTGWRLVTAAKPASVAATAVWIDGVPAVPGMSLRLKLARSSVTGLAESPVLVTLIPEIDWAGVDMAHRREIENRLSAIVAGSRTLDDQVRALARAAR